ncbi:CCC motif membrane protein [Pedobacter cryotolerans]|nr:CCC motif membrane protein [Pedobacter cryotolerans]
MSEEQFPQENPQQNNPFQQQNPFPPQNGGMGFNGMQQPLPNATIVLILGILSILTCCCYGVIGLILAIVALVLSKKDRALYALNMGSYTEGSFKNLNAGRVCAIIGLILNIIYLVLCIIAIMMFGLTALSDQDALREALENMK